jgi:hypothetical protein
MGGFGRAHHITGGRDDAIEGPESGVDLKGSAKLRAKMSGWYGVNGARLARIIRE